MKGGAGGRKLTEGGGVTLNPKVANSQQKDGPMHV